MSDFNEEQFAAALNTCWTHGGGPKWLRAGFWQMLTLDDVVHIGHTRRSTELFKAVKRAERQLAADWKWRI